MPNFFLKFQYFYKAMLQLQFFREQRTRVETGLKKRNWSDADIAQTINNILALDDTRRSTQTELDNTLSDANQLSKKIGILMKAGEHTEGVALKAMVTELKEKSEQLKIKSAETIAELDDILLSLPNIPSESTPFGKTADDNEVWQPCTTALPELGESALPHWDISAKYGVFDLELGVKITGAGFPVFRGRGAKLVRALIQFFLDEAAAAGYEEIVPPIVVNEASARGTGQIPDKEGQMYYVPKDDLYLIPTAEVPVTNVLRDVILTEKDLPTKLCAYSQCFRREAGSYGAHVRGLNRVHQFDKVEIVQFVKPENSYTALLEMVEHIKGLMDKLELPYRILNLCGGDMGNAAAKTFDFEAWSAAQKRWLEVSSVSNFETFQANRLKCRYKDANGKTQLVHTLNGSALALPRIIASILENHQTTDGVKIPKALQLYTKFDILN
ncbi:MAG: serine--tRNA ligase [Saprospiraceae bacterium]|nr:serine--tRNA ligase [Saprospiraceae bacterium]